MPLSQFRVLQIGSGVALDYCGKLFADFGSDVVKLEPAGGDPLRRMPPVLANGDSGMFAWLNANKQSVIDTVSDRARLLHGADLLLLQGADAEGPRITTSISWFGEDGPYAGWAATEATVRALGGLVALTGRAEGPPTIATDGQQGVMAGLAAFLASAAGLYDGGKRRLSVSILETAVNIAEYEAAVAWDIGASRKRPGVNRFGRNYPVGIYPTADGFIGVTIVTPGQWRGFCAMMGMPDLAKNPRYAINTERLRLSHEIDALLAPVWRTRTATEWFELALEYKLPMAVVPTMAELLHQKVHRERGAFVPIRTGDIVFDAPVLPQRLSATPPRAGGVAPALGSDNVEWDARPPAAAAEGLPLRNMRIVDLTMGWAGPTATRHLADMGAEIVKVEACQYPDWWRGTDLRAEFIAQQKYEKIPWFQLMNRNKCEITLDLTNPEGVAILKKLVAKADAVIENYSAEVLLKLGLDYDVLKTVRPGLVMLAMPAFGSGNAWSACRAYGSTLEHASGLPTITGFPDDPPTMNQTAYGDPIGGFNASAGLLGALLHQQATGEGQFIDMSQVECMVPLAASALIAQSATGVTPPRMGNRHPLYVPQGCFRCQGEDAWVAVSVVSDAMWGALCGLIGREDLAGMTAAERRTRQDELERLIGAWTSERSADEAMAAMQKVGVAAGAVRVPMLLPDDPHLKARGFWRWVDRPFTGPHWQSSAAFREGNAPYPIRRPAPTLGQDNAAILTELAGLDADQIAALAATDIIGTVPKPRRAQSDQ